MPRLTPSGEAVGMLEKSLKEVQGGAPHTGGEAVGMLERSLKEIQAVRFTPGG